MLLEGKNGKWTMSKYSLELGLPRWLSSKKSACAAGDVWDRCPGRGHDNPLQYSCLENPQRQRSLEGYRVTEFEMTEATEHSTAFITHVLCNRHCFKYWMP